MSTGSFRIDLVQQAFRQAARRLEKMAASARGSRPDQRRVNYLSALFDLQRVLQRPYGDLEEYLEAIGADERLYREGGGGGSFSSSVRASRGTSDAGDRDGGCAWQTVQKQRAGAGGLTILQVV